MHRFPPKTVIERCSNLKTSIYFITTLSISSVIIAVIIYNITQYHEQKKLVLQSEIGVSWRE